jgi:hypothetical protein
VSRYTNWLRAGVSIPGMGREFFFSSPRPDLLWGPPNLLSDVYRGAISPGIKRPGREANHSPSSSTEFKNAWSYTSIHTNIFMAWYFIKPRDNFTFTLPLFSSFVLVDSVTFP